LAWCLQQGASQAAIAEHAQSSLSNEQQGVLTQALIHVNTTNVHGVTISTVLLSADGFINGLAAVTQDALELSSSDVFLLALVYEPHAGGSKKKKTLLQSRLLDVNARYETADPILYTEAWQGGEEALRSRRLRASFDAKDKDKSGYLDTSEIAAALQAANVVASRETVQNLFTSMDVDGNGKIDFEEFCEFAKQARLSNKKPTMIVIGRARAGVNLKSVKLNKLLEPLGGGGHSKAASATIRLHNESQATTILQDLVDDLIAESLQSQPTVGDFMTAPVLSVQPHMTEKQVEDLFVRYDVRALPVVDEDNNVIGLVTYKEVAAAKQRLWNKEQKRLRREQNGPSKGENRNTEESKKADDRRQGSAVKAWMLQHVQIVEASKTMAQVESILLENDVGCIPVVADGTKQLVGMVTRTDLLRQHRYYNSLIYHNKGYADSIAARKPIIELRKKLKQFDIE
jgi:CBS domain-containing protein